MNRPAWSSLLFAAVALLAAGPVGAQGKPAADYPNRPVRIIIPQAAGGAVDVAARPIAQKLTEEMEKWARVAKAAGIYQSQ